MLQKGNALRIGGVEAAEMDGDLAAADHADVLHLIRAQHETLGGVRTARVDGKRPLNGEIFASSPADGARDGTVGEDRHFCACAPGHGAGGRHDDAQHRGRSAVQSGEHFVKQSFHVSLRTGQDLREYRRRPA